MSHPYIHAISSARIFGGKDSDYIHIHNWFDETKAWCPDWRHRAIRHHEEGINECIEIFGEELTNSNGDQVSMLQIGVQHVIEDVGFLAKARDWMEHFDPSSWEAFKKQKTEDRQSFYHEMGDKIPLNLLNLIMNA